jgi:hypothetical protein
LLAQKEDGGKLQRYKWWVQKKKEHMKKGRGWKKRLKMEVRRQKQNLCLLVYELSQIVSENFIRLRINKEA